jgi:hypothetical protein
MNRPVLLATTLSTLALLISVPTAQAKGKSAKADVCHWDSDASEYKLLNVSTNSAHFDASKHGDDLDAGDYYVDSDGDGSGDWDSAVSDCPTDSSWSTDNDDDFPNDAGETTDSDGDGVGDNSDLCEGEDSSGDSDYDGVCDDEDLCEGDDSTGDTDGDYICDDEDACPTEDATGQDEDYDGCIDDTGEGDECLTDMSWAVTHTASVWVMSSATGDLDGDGDLDVAGGSQIFLNDGTGSFSATATSGGYGWSQHLSDIDGDGDLDVLNCELGNPTLWENDGSGGFTFLSTLSIGQTRGGCVFEDLDGDGDTDAYLGGYQRADRVYLNDGSGNFTLSSSPTAGSHRDTTQNLASADIDGDGDLDIIDSNGDSFTSPDGVIWLNDGSAGFTASTETFGGYTGRAVSTGDFDGDGNVDIFAGIKGADQIWFGDGTGAFTDSGQALATCETNAVTLADVDYDGDLDAVVGCRNVGVRIYENDGAGTFTHTDSLNHTGENFAPGAADYNGDGAMDIFTTGYVGSRVWEGTCAP